MFRRVRDLLRTGSVPVTRSCELEKPRPSVQRFSLTEDPTAAPAGRAGRGRDGCVVRVDSWSRPAAGVPSGAASREAVARAAAEALAAAGHDGAEVLDAVEGVEDAAAAAAVAAALAPAARDVALAWAAYLGRREVVTALLAAGADPAFAPGGRCLGALHYAALGGHARLCELLLAAGADAQQERGGHTPLQLAVLGRSAEAVAALAARGARHDDCHAALLLAVRADVPDCLQELLSYCDAGRVVDDDSFGPLHVAADAGHARCLRLLLAAPGVRAEARARRGETALHLAARGGFRACVEALVARGAVDAGARNARGQTPLHLAAQSRSAGCARALLDAPNACPVDARDDDDRTALHYLRALQSPEMTQLLIERNADVNARDRYEYTPLHVAAHNELTASARALLLAGADVTARTRGGVSALASVVRKVPGALKALHQRLDAAVSIHDASTTILDSTFINDTHAVHDDVVVSLNFKPLLQFSSPGEIDYLKAFVDEGYKDILKHPLCRAFLHFKWKKVRKFYVVKLLFYLLFVSVLTACVLPSNARHFSACKSSNETETKTADFYRRSSVPFWNRFHYVNESRLQNATQSTAEINALPQSESKENDAKNYSNTTDSRGFERIQKDTKGPNKNDALRYDLMVILSLLATIEAVRAIYSISGYSSWIEYCWHLDNVLEWLVELSVIVWIVMEAVEICVSSCKCIQDHVGVVALILAYFMLTRIVGHLPQFQAYVSMYMSVLRLFLRALAAYIFLLLGFVFAFCAAFPGIDTFSNPATGIVRVTSMMAGDILYEDTFKENIKLQITSHILFMSFVLFVTIVLMNLLVGLAVHDIQGLQSTAELVQLVQQTRLVAQVERALLCERAPRLLRRWLCVSPGRYRKVFLVRPLSRVERRLPAPLLSALYVLARQPDRSGGAGRARPRAATATTGARGGAGAGADADAGEAGPAPAACAVVLAAVERLAAEVAALRRGLEDAKLLGRSRSDCWEGEDHF